MNISRIASVAILPVVAAAALTVTACADDDTPPPQTEVQAHMSEHFRHASDLQRAVVNGDMDAIASYAGWIADHSKM